MRELSLFSGGGGGLLGTKWLLGWRTVGYVEWEDYPQRVLAARIKDGLLDDAPIFGDIHAFIRDGYARSYQGMVDVISAGFPCQPFSLAGQRRGDDDERNQWPATITTINIIRPRFCLLENVPGLLSARDTVCNECGYAESHWDDEQESELCGACGAEVVETAENTFWYFASILRDLAEIGYDARWRVLSAAELGAPHKRDRLWIVADAKSERKHRECGNNSGTSSARHQDKQELNAGGTADVADAKRSGRVGRAGQQRARWGSEPANGSADVADASGAGLERHAGHDATHDESRWHTERQNRQASGAGVFDGRDWWATEPDVGRVAHRVASRVDRLKAIGNGQVPAVAARAWLELTGGLI